MSTRGEEKSREWSARGAVLAFAGGRAARAEARRCFAQAMLLDPKNVSALRNYAFTLVEDRALDTALTLFDLALEMAPLEANGHYGRGVCLVRLGRVSEAIVAFERALTLAPGDADAERELRASRELLALDKEDARAWYQHGAALQRAGLLERAVAAFDEVVAISARRRRSPDGDLVHAHQNLAVCLAHLRRFRAAAEHLAAVRELARAGGARWLEEMRRATELYDEIRRMALV